MIFAQNTQELQQSAHDSALMLWGIVLLFLAIFFVIAISDGSGPDDGVPGNSNIGCAAVFGIIFALVFFGGIAMLIW